MIVRLSLLHDGPEIKSPALGGAAGGRGSSKLESSVEMCGDYE